MGLTSEIDSTTDHYATAEQLLAQADDLCGMYHTMPAAVDAKAQRLITLAEAHIKLMQVDATRSHAAAIREQTAELADVDRAHRSTVI